MQESINRELQKESFYQPTKVDFVLAGLILIFSVIVFMSFRKFVSDEEKTALVYRNNKLIQELKLSKESIINLDRMQIEIKEGKIRVVNFDCPEKTCVHTGWISNPFQTIVCVPNKVLIEIVSSEKIKYDAVTPSVSPPFQGGD